MTTTEFAPGLWCADVQYQDTPELIACGVIETEEGLLLVDPGPAVSLTGLSRSLQALGATWADVHGLLLTHIHLDHAGGTGTLVARHPALRVFVHALGARHLVDPSRLLASAQRIYGEQMQTLWGDFLPVPVDNVKALSGGETLRFGRRVLRVDYTPGHAIHHVSYLDEATGTAFVGDVGGMRVPGVTEVLPVTPPPDVDLPAWHESLATVRAWGPELLFLTHFGAAPGPGAHLDAMAANLDAWAERVRAMLDDDSDDATSAQAFHEAVLDDLRRHIPPDRFGPYERFGQPLGSWYGLARYWRKQAAATSRPSTQKEEAR